MAIPRHIRRQLPKAALIQFGWWGDTRMWAKFRLANSVQWHFGSLVVWHRAPYLEHVARVHYPHLFDQEPAP